jgi:hypothetical protein
MLKMEVITNKKDLIKIIGDWETNNIQSDYEIGSNKIALSYKDRKVAFISDDVTGVAYIALQCHSINNNQYSKILHSEYRSV